MKKNAMRGCTVLAILLAVFCVIAFAVPFARTKGFWLGFGFGLFAILFQLYIFRSAETVNGSAKSRFYGFPVARIGVVYLAAQLAVSLAEIASFVLSSSGAESFTRAISNSVRSPVP